MIFFLNSNYPSLTTNTNTTTTTTPPNSIASALTQFMLAQGISPQQHQLQSLLTGMSHTMAHPFTNSTTPSPSSSNNSSSSSSLSTSPSTPSSNIYDFNLALKMYQIQLQSLMTANYLQTLQSSGRSATTTGGGGVVESAQSLAGHKKRKHHEIDHNNNSRKRAESDDEHYSPQDSPSVKSMSSKMKSQTQFNTAPNKKLSKNTV